MLNKALQAFEDLGDDEELGPADWPTVEKYISSLKDSEGEQVHPHSGSKTGNLDSTSLKDIRIRFLNGNYHVIFEPITLIPLVKLFTLSSINRCSGSLLGDA